MGTQGLGGWKAFVGSHFQGGKRPIHPILGTALFRSFPSISRGTPRGLDWPGLVATLPPQEENGGSPERC